MSSEDFAIRVTNLSKRYEIYNTPRDRLKQFVLPSLQRLAKRPPRQYFREFWALKDVSFEVKKGETVGIIGRNGSGKSTLLQIICGTLSPTSGTVETNGRIAALLELGSGFNPEFTGRENVYMNGAVIGLSKEEIDERFDDICTFADIGDFIEQPVKTYSSGMFVRLAFAIQANVDPEILIVDEALAVGDAYFVHRCMQRFNEMQAQGVTILFVSHDATAVRSLCHRAIWVNRGQVVMSGTSVEVTDHYLAHLFDHPIVETASPKLVKTDDMNRIVEETQEKNKFIAVHEMKIQNIDLRTGDQSCCIIGLGLYNTSMNPISTTLNDIEIFLRVTTKNNFTDKAVPIAVGYTLRDFRGLDISSSDTIVTNTNLGLCPPGELITVSIKIQLPILHPGMYSFSPSTGYIMPNGMPLETDRIQNAIVFEIFSAVKVNIGMSFKTEFKREMPS